MITEIVTQVAVVPAVSLTTALVLKRSLFWKTMEKGRGVRATWGITLLLFALIEILAEFFDVKVENWMGIQHTWHLYLLIGVVMFICGEIFMKIRKEMDYVEFRLLNTIPILIALFIIPAYHGHIKNQNNTTPVEQSTQHKDNPVKM